MRIRHGIWTILLFTLGDAHAAAITVNTATDDFGSNLSNCSLREAIQSANNNADFGGCDATGLYNPAIADVITLPTIAANSFFTLTRVGTDDSNNSGDLDIAGNVNINGVSATNTLIRGNVNDPANERHRLMHIISGNVVLNDLTLRDGLEDGSTAAGGLRIGQNESIVTLNRVTVTANSAGGNAGGILNRGTLNINDSLISNNETVDSDNGGGGIFNSLGGTVTINDSRILNNTVNASISGTAGGGGIYNDIGATLTLNNSVVDGNLADGRRLANDRNAFGGGIYDDNEEFNDGVVTLVQSSVTNNEAVGKDSKGGGIFSQGDQGLLIVDRSVISFNRATSVSVVEGQTAGGGIFVINAISTVQDSVISGNEISAGFQSRGGGLNGEFLILRSTIANNSADELGGGLHTGASVVINSTFIGNEASVGGGMSFASGVGQPSQVFSSTVAGNAATDSAGGIRRGGNGDLTLANTVLALNSATNSGPDCTGTILSQGHNLLQNNSGCGLVANGNDKINIASGLASVANNGGLTAGASLGTISAMQTRSPLSNSALVDAGDPSGCKDEDGVVLTTDQIGRDRAIAGLGVNPTITCDIGAIEFSILLFKDGFE